MNNNALADIIEQSISKMFNCITGIDSRIKEYTILFNPNKSKNWIVIFFFADKANLKNSLNDGLCYTIDRFMRNELILTKQSLPLIIQFDLGKRPSNNTEVELLFEKYTMAYDTLENENGQIKICPTCGHDWNKHKLLGCLENSNSFPSNGWMICPDEDCFCFRTWDIKL